MSAERGPIDDAALEAALIGVGRQIVYPPVPDLSSSVRAHLDAHPRPAARRFRFLRPAVLSSLLAAIVVVTSVLALSPDSRAAVASWFHVIGVRIEFGGSAPGPIGKGLNLGRRVSLSEAQRDTAFPILVPDEPGLPDEVYTGTPPLTRSVSLLYRARRGLPRSAATGAGLLITEYENAFLDVKFLSSPSSITPLTILGDRAIWISGLPHVVYDIDAKGRLLRDTIRLAGNVLIWYHSGITIRLEGRVSMERAIAIARSMRAVNRSHSR